ncbi:MAG: M20/M25/M40 family metallo-hydrolase [Flavonifractor plautii]
MLQGHLDMVCAVRPGSGWNPLTDPVAVVVEGGFLRSDGRSSLGADNHLGNAAALWLLSTGAVNHGPLRLLFTTAEEVGLEGAKEVAPDWLAGAEYLLNTDGFHLGRAVVGSASGRRETWAAPWTPGRPRRSRLAAHPLRRPGRPLRRRHQPGPGQPDRRRLLAGLPGGGSPPLRGLHLNAIPPGRGRILPPGRPPPCGRWPPRPIPDRGLRPARAPGTWTPAYSPAWPFDGTVPTGVRRPACPGTVGAPPTWAGPEPDVSGGGAHPAGVRRSWPAA